LDVKLNDVLGEEAIKAGAVEKGKRSVVRKAIKARLEDRFEAFLPPFFYACEKSI
jgi:hypothetical protein